MVPELDIYRSASATAGAGVEAQKVMAIASVMRADECLAAGDMEEEVVWLRIGRAVEELQRTQPRRDEAIH